MSKQRSDPNETSATAGLPLFDTPARQMSARTDPPTSRQAALRMLNSGQLGADQLVALKMVRARPGSTCPELAAVAAGQDTEHRSADFWRQKIGRRLNELAKTDPPLIQARHASGPYACWWPADFQKRED